MPELPEVETVRRELVPLLTSRRITRVEIYWHRLIDRPAPEIFVQHLVGTSITALRRRGKYLIFDLDSGEHWLIHLRMTGQIYVRQAQAPIDAHTHARVYLDDGGVIHYRDQRKFGRFYLVRDEDQVVGDLGPEPLSEDWQPEDLAERIRGRRARIKTLLLDQRVVAGLGNIYADEALFLARIHPACEGGRLTEAQVRRLHRAIRQVLLEALRARGSTMSTYIPPSERRGEYQQQRRVYRRKGQPCPVCGTPIEHMKLSGRSTYFCPRCQPFSC